MGGGGGDTLLNTKINIYKHEYIYTFTNFYHSSWCHFSFSNQPNAHDCGILLWCLPASLYYIFIHVVFFSFTDRIQWQATTGKTGVVQSGQAASHTRTDVSDNSTTATHPTFLIYCVYIQTQEVYYHHNLIFFDLAIISVSRLFGHHSVLELRYKANTFSFSLVLYCGPPQSEYVALAEGKSM